MDAAAIRKWKRVKVDVRVRLRRWDEPETATSVVRTYELSKGGVSVYASEILEVGSVVWVGFALPDSVEFGIKAVVRSRRGFRLGMAFVDLLESERIAIENYLAAVEGMVEV
jgi:hypothetical protein